MSKLAAHPARTSTIHEIFARFRACGRRRSATFCVQIATVGSEASAQAEVSANRSIINTASYRSSITVKALNGLSAPWRASFPCSPSALEVGTCAPRSRRLCAVGSLFAPTIFSALSPAFSSALRFAVSSALSSGLFIIREDSIFIEDFNLFAWLALTGLDDYLAIVRLLGN
eukprot:CAMPEP_0170173378 /NCGR_PEP_ID=MMETSP0040_2-20121228/6663_1 /TAXON_ID=641309 /ORGANISM="Lotharella oceanica, Strain CCMP622" /LENGTH=171 /DNA_ID=CAMNT_0010414533 /DNA_START=419 /DNA_END=931 /DNA_ORIENTATION=-